MKQELESEILSFRQSVNLIHRRPDLTKMVIGLYGLSLFGLDRGRVMRASYLPVRYVDDLLDGDISTEENPIDYARNLQQRITNNSLGNSPIDQQFKYALTVLEKKTRANDDPRRDFVRSIDAIIFDRSRAKARSSLSANEIEVYYRQTFDPVINITLMAMDSSLRSRDLPVLSFGQGRVYSVRDIDTDWQRGIINIPQEVLAEAQLDSYAPVDAVKRNPRINSWFRESLLLTRPYVVNAIDQLKLLQEKQTSVVCNGLLKPMLHFIDNFGQKEIEVYRAS